MLFRAALFAVAVFVVSAEDDTAGPVFLKEPPNRVDFSNTTGAVVECSASGNPPPDIIWVSLFFYSPNSVKSKIITFKIIVFRSVQMVLQWVTFQVFGKF